jgi:hypothetical protein
MRTRLSCTLWACMALLALSAAPLHAQVARRYQPSRPTVSPYLNLFRNNVGPLPNYYSLVRPQINQLAVNNQVAAQQAQQSAGLNLLQSQTNQLAATPTGKNGWFMTYGHQSFMSGPGTGGGGVGRSAGAPTRLTGGKR